MQRSCLKLLAMTNNRLALVRAISAPANFNATIPTMREVRHSLMQLIGYDATWGEDKTALKKALSENLKKPEQLAKNRMQESYAEAIIPLQSEPELRNRYANFQQCVRFGRLLEDLDTMAVHVAYLHNKSQNISLNGHTLSPIVIVTALVDRIEVSTTKMAVDKNLKLSGFTSWVGRSSSEITMRVEQEVGAGVWLHMLDAKFLVCARDTSNQSSAAMCQLEVVTGEEKAIYELGTKSQALRQKEAQISLVNSPPNNAESLLIHEMFKKTIDLTSGSFKIRVKPPNTVWMEEAMLKNVIICFPEQRNLYNKIFGGFLMRQAFEIAWANASLFIKSVPRIKVVDNISFKRPVLIGSLLFLSSQVVFTENNLVQVRVHAQTVNPTTNVMETTNDFYFKFSAPPTSDMPQVMPKSYAESMMYIDGKRHM